MRYCAVLQTESIHTSNVCFLHAGFETAWSDSCWSPEEDYEQPSRNEGAAGQRDGAIVTSVYCHWPSE